METNKRKRKMTLLLFMPIMLLPFLALGFYAMGGGRSNLKNQKLGTKGINTLLPEANFKNQDPIDKMGFYANAPKDTSLTDSNIRLTTQFNLSSEQERKSLEINQKIAELNHAINAPNFSEQTLDKKSPSNLSNENSIKQDLDRLQQMMRLMKEDQQNDPEMLQMNQMLEKILTIQNPNRNQLKLTEEKTLRDENKFEAINAVIHQNQKVINGAAVSIQLVEDLTLETVFIPKGQILVGLCKITNQRLLLTIKNIRLGKQIIPVDLSVFGMDGMIGIDAPDAIFKTATTDAADEALRDFQIYGLDGTAGQVAGAGIASAKKLFNNKLNLVKVKLKGGLPILLKDNKKNN